MSQIKGIQFAAALFVGVVFGLLVSSTLYTDNYQNAVMHGINNKNAFVLLVNLEFESGFDKTRFERMFQMMAEYVKTNEPLTLSYELAEDDKVIIIERYSEKSAYLEVHKTSKDFLEFRNQFDTFNNLKISGRSYIESNLGYMDR